MESSSETLKPVAPPRAEARVRGLDSTAAAREINTAAIGDELTRTAAVAIAASAGWAERPFIGPHTIIVSTATDTTPSADPGTGQRRILMVEPNPFACRTGLDALNAGVVFAVVALHEPRELIPALEAVQERRALVSGGVFDLAARMPVMSQRQLTVLCGLVAGQSNRDIARALYVSEATIKREVIVMDRLLGVATRTALAAAATELGVPPRTATP